jgi:hypothetical protein
MCALEYIGRILNLLWLSCTFSNKANMGASYPKSYRNNKEKLGINGPTFIRAP